MAIVPFENFSWIPYEFNSHEIIFYKTFTAPVIMSVKTGSITKSLTIVNSTGDKKAN